MTCYHCKTEFCWLCGEQIPSGGVGWHYDARNLFGCGGRQMDEHARRGMSNAEALRAVYARRACYVVLLGPIALACLVAYWAVGCYVFLPCALLLSLASATCGDGEWHSWADTFALLFPWRGYDRLEDVGWTVRILGVLILLSYWVVLPATLIPLVIVPAMTSPPPSPPSPPSPPGAPHPWPFPPNAPGAPFPPTVVDCSLEPTNSTLYAEFCSSDEEGDWWSSNWWWIFLVIIGGCSVFGKEDD